MAGSDGSDLHEPPRLSDDDVRGRVDLRHWRVGGRRVHGTFATGSFLRGVELVRRLGDVAEDLGHHPDVVLTYPTVGVTSTTHDVDALTERDVLLAGRISQVLDSMGIDAVPEER